jgi:hypothetical protein
MAGIEPVVENPLFINYYIRKFKQTFRLFAIGGSGGDRPGNSG